MSESKEQIHRSVLINNIPCTIDTVEYDPPEHCDRPNLITTSKYTIVNFIPKNLFEQFRRLANFYFLVISMLQMASNSPVTPATSLVPLSFVIGVTALKQAYEDFLRHKTDNEVNGRSVSVIRNDQHQHIERVSTIRKDHEHIGRVQQIECQDIRIGDLVSIADNHEIPVDMVLLSTGLVDGKCYVMTANLDGESNFKEKETLEVTKNATPSELSLLKGIIECDLPNSDLYDFTGTAHIVDNETNEATRYPLTVKNLVMRGSKLMNSKFAYGIAVYTGSDTKLALNSKSSLNKFSSIEAAANFYLAGYLAILIIFTLICSCINFAMTHSANEHWYLQPLIHDIHILAFFDICLSYFVLLNYLIPISLYVTLEMVKFFGSKKLVHDPELVDPFSGESAKCNSSDLNEELGQIEYLFSDKTGTLTQNKMEFRCCSIDGVVYHDEDIDKLETKSRIIDFFICIVCCTSVHVQRIITDGNESINYFADSPDEKTLVEAAAKFGVQLIYNTSSVCKVKIGLNDGEVIEFKRLCTLPFDSHRKRMSVIMEKPDGKIEMMTKGADVEMDKWISSGKISEITAQMEQFALKGLRTLVIAKKKLTRSHVCHLKDQIYQSSFKKKKSFIINVYSEFEKNLTILGAVAIEDKLQDGVEDAISTMKKAGIKIWLLTGDKQETAIAVARSSHLITYPITELIMSRCTDEHVCDDQINTLLGKIVEAGDDQRFALIVDGRSLYFSMKNHLIKFRKLCKSCVVVICCRMSPIQKAEVVKMIKNSPGSPITAAIGDGANDVSMIQEAHVGFGLMGKEGRQAANSADFAFTQFRFIKRVLLVHGNLFYHRVSTLIHYFFYKNVVFVTPQFLFTFYNLYSSQTLYEVIQLISYNMAYTSFPILIYGIHEEYLPGRLLESNPSLYKKNLHNSNMDCKKMLSWFLNGAFHGCAIYFFYIQLFSDSLFENGFQMGIYDLGTAVFHGVVLIVNLKLALLTKRWTRWQIFCTTLSIVALFILHYTWKVVPFRLIRIPDQIVDYHQLLTSRTFIVSLLIGPFLVLLPDAAGRSINNVFISMTADKTYRG